MPKPSSNPLFTRSETKRARKKVAQKIKGAARKGFSKLFGIPLSPGLGGTPATRRRRRPGSASTANVRGDVVSALTNQGYKKPAAEKMVPQPASGEGFESLFRRAVAKNPGELIIFGNPEKVYSRRALRKANPLPAIAAAAMEGVGWTAGSKLFEVATGKKKPTRKRSQRGKRNPDQIDQATELFEKFHKRGPEGVFEMHQSAKRRKEFTIIGPLVALGINAEKFDKIKPREDDVVQHWERLPHMAFLTGPQVAQVKAMLGDPERYIRNAAMLASSPNGKQLYVVSSEPLEINVGQFETDTQKDFVDLGQATFVVYIAKKPHEVLEWVHTFAEEGGERPRLVFDKLTKQILFIGGSYSVEGPGIIN